MEKRRIIVSIDFGTTYSGVSWAETSRPDVQHVVSSWPAIDGLRSSLKVPTELRKLATGWQWGFQIPEDAKRYRFFKLKLDEPDRPSRDGDTPLELARIYLSCLHDHFIGILEKKLSRAVVQMTPMDFVVTVPAIWSNTAKQATERAAAMAGFCGNKRILLISEPEAAALYTIKHLGPSVLKPGKNFVLCDAGGGTVDLISYEVSHSGNLAVKEITEGTGGKCGSAMLNKRFRRYLKQTHGDKYWTNERLILAIAEFESFKKDFSPKGEPLTIRVDESLGLKRNRFTIPQTDMTTRIFTPIMKDIICLIKEQIGLVADEIAAVVLVGGFGESSYLKSEVKAALARNTPVLQPDNGWIAVVKGAVIHGLGYYHPSLTQVQIVSRIARRSYGTCLLAAYDMLRHDPKEAVWSPKEGEMVVAEMCWFIRKGESYTEGIPTAIDYQCDIPVSSGPVPQTEIEIFCNDDPEPPIHCTSRTTCIATLALNLDKIPMSTKNAAGVTRIGNHRYFCLTGAIEASYGSAMITYKVKLGGVTHDALTVRYENQGLGVE
ncbi:phosphatidylinositol 3 [Metarhizium brunneum]